MNQRKFVRCYNCKLKPATVKCFDCSDVEPTKLCYHCDAQIHPDSDHQKQIIPYDQMVEAQMQEDRNDRQERSITPIKEPPKPISRSPQRSDSQQHHLSSILRSRIKKNGDENTLVEDFGNISKNQLKTVELKFRIKFQEQENTINLLKQHIEQIEAKHKENLSKMRDQLIKTQDEQFKKQEEHQSEIIKMRKLYEDKINSYVQQLDSEAQFNNSLQAKLDETRSTHQIKVQELQQQVTQLKAEIERRKFQEEKIQIEADNQLITQRKESQAELEKQIAAIKGECQQQVDEQKARLSQKTEQIQSLQQQIQQLQSTLKDVDMVWQKKMLFETQVGEEYKQKFAFQKEESEHLVKEIRNLQAEIMIYQKENELFQKEKLTLTKQLNNLQEKSEKMDRFIYGNKKTNRSRM